MINRKKILAICGSTKTNSTNELILRQIAKLYGESFDFEIHLNIADLPHFNPDLDNDEVPDSVKEFREYIEKADGVIISTPEYVFSLPGSLKNAIEWTVSTTIFFDKPTAFIIAAASGEKAFDSLELILQTIGANVSEHSKLIIKAAKVKLNLSKEITDKAVLEAIDKLIKSLANQISK